MMPFSHKTIGTWAFITCFVLLALIARQLHAEPEVDWKPVGIGTGLLVAPIPMASSDLSWGHTIELEGWSYAATDIFGRFLPKDYWFLSPIMVTVVDTMYRAGEGLDQDLTRRKLACDLLGVAGRVTIEIKFQDFYAKETNPRGEVKKT